MTVKSLFRSQAVDHKKNRLHGEVLLIPKLSYIVLSGIISAWVLCVLVWLFNSSYARKETVLGWLEPPNGVIRVYPEDTGIIKAVLIAEGDRVSKDQPLIVINGDRVLASGQHMQAQLLEEYESQRRLLDEQLQRVETTFSMRTSDIKQQVSAANRELNILKTQLTTISQRQDMLDKQVASYKSLWEDGHVSSMEYDNMINQKLSLSSERQSILRDQVAQNNLIEQLETQKNLLPDENANKISQLRERLSATAQKIAQLNGQRSYVLKAPRDGVINNLQAIEGQQARPGSNIPLLTLIPNDAQLTAQLLIPVRSIGFVEPMQFLDIRYDAFPYQKFGLYSGQIKSVSKTLFLPNELLNAPIVLQEPVYRVSASLHNPSVHAYGKEFSLKPGMTLSADVRLGERTLMQWLLEPIYSLKGRL